MNIDEIISQFRTKSLLDFSRKQLVGIATCLKIPLWRPCYKTRTHLVSELRERDVQVNEPSSYDRFDLEEIALHSDIDIRRKGHYKNKQDLYNDILNYFGIGKSDVNGQVSKTLPTREPEMVEIGTETEEGTLPTAEIGSETEEPKTVEVGIGGRVPTAEIGTETIPIEKPVPKVLDVSSSEPYDLADVDAIINQAANKSFVEYEYNLNEKAKKISDALKETLKGIPQETVEEIKEGLEVEKKKMIDDSKKILNEVKERQKTKLVSGIEILPLPKISPQLKPLVSHFENEVMKLQFTTTKQRVPQRYPIRVTIPKIPSRNPKLT